MPQPVRACEPGPCPMSTAPTYYQWDCRKLVNFILWQKVNYILIRSVTFLNILYLLERLDTPKFVVKKSKFEVDKIRRSFENGKFELVLYRSSGQTCKVIEASTCHQSEHVLITEIIQIPNFYWLPWLPKCFFTLNCELVDQQELAEHLRAAAQGLVR